MVSCAGFYLFLFRKLGSKQGRALGRKRVRARVLVSASDRTHSVDMVIGSRCSGRGVRDDKSSRR